METVTMFEPNIDALADGKDQPIFIKRDVLVDAILKTDAGAKRTVRHTAEVQHV